MKSKIIGIFIKECLIIESINLYLFGCPYGYSCCLNLYFLQFIFVVLQTIIPYNITIFKYRSIEGKINVWKTFFV